MLYPIKYRVNIVWEISEAIIFGNFPKLLITSSFSIFVKFPIILQWETSQSFLPLSPPNRKIPKPMFWEVSYTLYFLTPIHIGNFPISPPYCPFETDIFSYRKDFPVTCTGKFFLFTSLLISSFLNTSPPISSFPNVSCPFTPHSQCPL